MTRKTIVLLFLVSSLTGGIALGMAVLAFWYIKRQIDVLPPKDTTKEA